MSFAGAGKLVTSLNAAQKAAKAANTFKTLAMIGKGTWAIMDVASLGMDLYMFGDELDKAINPNHDPQLKQLVKDVSELGLKYDPLMTKVVAANTSINNLLAGLTGLHNLYDDFTAKQGIAFDQLEKLGQLTEKLKKSAPTTYDWFSKTFFPKVDVNKDQFDKLKDRMGSDTFTLVTSGVGVGISGMLAVPSVRAARASYKEWKNRNNRPPDNNSPGGTPDAPTGKPTGGLGDNNAKPALFGGDVPPVRTQNRNSTRSRLKTAGKWAFKGFNKVMTVGSFGMSIYVIVMRERQRDKDIETLTNMKADYEKDIELYTAVLEGCKQDGFEQVKLAFDQAKLAFDQAELDKLEQAKQAFEQAKQNLEQKVDQAKRDKVAQFFGIDLIQQTEQGKETLAIGYNGVIKDYDTQVDQLLNDMDGVYTDMIQKFEDLKISPDDEALITDLKKSQKRFQESKPKGQDETIDSTVRKESLDQLREEFSKTIAQEMNKLNASLNKAIADHTALAMLEPFAIKIIQEAEEDEVPITDKKLNRESQTILSTLDLTQSNRTRFKTVEEIFQGLKTLIAELQKKAS